MRICLIVLGVIAILTGCKEKKVTNPLELFHKADIINGNILPIEGKVIGNPISIQIIDSLILIMNKNSEYYLDVFSKKNGNYLGASIKKGRGPKELSRAISIDRSEHNKSIDIFTRVPKKVNTITVKNLFQDTSFVPVKTREFKIDDGSCYHVKRTKNYFIGTGSFSHGMYAIFNSEGVLIGNHGAFPSLQKGQNLESRQKGRLFQGFLKVKEGSNRFVFATNCSEILEINEILHDSIQEIKKYHYRLPDFLMSKNRVVKRKESIMGYCCLEASDEYIFALYTEKTLKEYMSNPFVADNILVFDWNGKPIKRFKLDIGLNSIAYDKDSKSIIGIGLSDELFLIKYELDI
ncbi:BF3164 family lipoprotein [Marinifilum caeruleilacunae]|uniref:TolB-like 6-blade propeller-like n=1 Tax=Marinifilum caeruleilacunae TaxID=2499076 RepID=A0ABX1X0T3_9BACT|nr:BF3164 family lipoprotein [Marinifilum caeruleilacunae]NOU62025.1 hypothetical protein [Marinifilum caeruleilacunae]